MHGGYSIGTVGDRRNGNWTNPAVQKPKTEISNWTSYLKVGSSNLKFLFSVFPLQYSSNFHFLSWLDTAPLQLRSTAQRPRTELLSDLIHRVTELFFPVRALLKQPELLRIAAIAMQVAGSDADQPDFLF